MTRENWTAMVDNELLPDFVISLEDEEAPEDYLLSRFVKIHNLPLPATLKNGAAHSEDEIKNDKGEEEVKVTACSKGVSDDFILTNRLHPQVVGATVDMTFWVGHAG